MAGPAADTQQEELEANIQAYLRIFQAILKKKAGDAARKKAVLQKLNAYIRKNVTTPDAIIDHIPQFSRALGVPEAALGNFIGANFIRALQQAKEELARKKQDAVASERAAARETEVRTFDSLLEELVYRFGGVVEAPNEFQPIDDGLMKLVTPSGEVMPVSLSGDSGADGNGAGTNGAAKDAPAGAAGKAPAGNASAPASSGADAKGAPPPPKAEKPLLDELIDKFGNVLDIPGKLEPSVWEDEQTEAPAGADGAGGGAGKKSAETAPAAGGDKPTQAAPKRVEKPLLDEVMERFGNVLDIPGKLEPSVWEEEESSMGGAAPAASADPGSAPQAADSAPGPAVPAEPEFEPIPMSFGEYAGIQKKVQAFQTSGNQAGYKAWLGGEAGLAGKALVGLRNLDLRERKGESIHWSDEYYNLSLHLDVDVRRVEDFHLRIKYYIRIQQTINGLTKTIKAQGAAVLGAAQKIWPHVLQIFHHPGDAQAYESQLKIILLQVSDAGLKQKLTEAVHPAFEQVAAIYNDLDH